MAKNKDKGLIGLLEIPLGSSRSGPTKRLAADMHEVALQLDRCRNFMVRAWLRWREDNPDWQPEPMKDKDGKPKRTKKGHPVFAKTSLAPLRVLHDGTVAGEDDSVTFGVYLYTLARNAFPSLASCLVSAAAQEVLSNLMTKANANIQGHLHRWQTILANDGQIPTFMARTIPVPHLVAGFCYGGRLTGGSKSEELKRHGQSSAVVLLPLWSQQAGRDVTSPIVTLNIGRLHPGNRTVLKRIASGEWAFSDSDLVFKNDRWQLQLTYRQPGEALQLDKARIAVLWPQFPEKNQPFYVESATDGRHWLVGNGALLAAEFGRLDARRKRIRDRFKVSLSGVKGHGRQRFEARLKPWARCTHNYQRHFAHQLANEVVRFCKRENCGTVVYREPTLGIREHLWLAARDVPFDWTGLEGVLSHTLRYYGIEYTVERANGVQLRERFGGGKPKSSGNGVNGVAPKEVAPNGATNGSREPYAGNGKGDAPNGKHRGRFRGNGKGKPLAGAAVSDERVSGSKREGRKA